MRRSEIEYPGAMSKQTGVMQELLREARKREGAMVRLLGRFVRCESPSGDKAAVDRFGAMVASEWRRRGAKVKILEQRLRGNHLRVEMVAAAKHGSGRDLARRDEKSADRDGWADSCAGASGYGLSDWDDCEDAVSREKREGLGAGDV